MRVTLITLLLSFYSPFSYADGKDFLLYCKGFIEMASGRQPSVLAMQAGTCLGTINGMRDMNTFYTVKLGKKEGLFCISQEVQAGQLIRVVIEFMENNPDKLQEHEANLVLYAFSESYPCQRM